MCLRLFSVSVRIVIVGFVTTLGCQEPPTAAPAVRPVRVVRIHDAAAFTSGYLPGRAKATQEVDLALRVDGPLIEFPVNVGDEVAKDDLMARVDPRIFQYEFRRTEADLSVAKAELKAMEAGARPEEIEQLRAALAKAEVQYRTAANELARVEPLAESKVITQSDYDRYVEDKELAEASLRQVREDLRIGEKGAREEDLEAKRAQVQSLEASLTLAKDRWRYTYLRAPFAGTVVAKYVENFEDVRAKQPIVRIVDTSKIEIVINVPEGSISLVPLVTDVTCTFDALPDNPLPAVVKEIGVEASQSTRTYPVTLIMDQPEEITILPGMAGRVRGRVNAPKAEEGGLQVEIPESSVFEQDDKHWVWVIESTDNRSGAVRLREVSIGKLSSRGLRLVSGLQSQELVATAGVPFLKAGQEVRLLESASSEASP